MAKVKDRKILLVYYTRTGTTEKAAKYMAERLGCALEEIRDSVERKGAVGYLRSGREAMRKKVPEIKDLKNNVREYDLVVIGTPIWVYAMASPVRAFILKHGKDFKKVAFFCTMGGDAGKTFDEMARLSGKNPLASVELLSRDVMKGDYAVKGFLKRLVS